MQHINRFFESLKDTNFNIEEISNILIGKRISTFEILSRSLGSVRIGFEDGTYVEIYKDDKMVYYKYVSPS